MDLLTYQEYNKSFKTKFIYRLGGCTGFFSEYNNMVLAIHYCIVNRIQFVLESENANFSSGKGWTEFFMPFCHEQKNRWLRRFNHRIKPVYKNRKEWFCFNVYKRFHPSYTYMYSLFSAIRDVDINRRYIVEELGLNGTLLENCSAIHRMIWKYNEGTSFKIFQLINNLHLPDKYVGMHIRLGDKDTETQLLSPNQYMEKVQQHSLLRDVFVLTDDYRAILDLEKSHPTYRFYTLCGEDEKGYDFPKLISRSREEQTQSYLRLWASMEILEHSSLFVGTYSANPGMNMGFRMEKEKIHCLDYDEWQLW